MCPRIGLPGSLGGVARPGDDLEIVRIITQESDAGGDGGERIIAQRGGGIGQGAALAGPFSEEIAHVAGGTRRHETDGLHTVHERTAVIIAILVAELEGEPVPVGAGEVHLQAVAPQLGGCPVDVLAPVREIELGIVAVVGSRTADEIAHGIVAVEVHQHRVWLSVLRLQIVSAHGDGSPLGAIRNGRDLHQIHLAFGSALGGNLDEVGFQLDGVQLFLGILPELVEIGLLVRRGNHFRGFHAEAEDARGPTSHVTGSLVEARFQVFVDGHVDVQRALGRHFHVTGEDRHFLSFVRGDTDLGLDLHHRGIRVLGMDDERWSGRGIDPFVLRNRYGERQIL